MAILCYLNNFGAIDIREAVEFGILAGNINKNGESLVNLSLQYANMGIKFFFVSLAFGYFANHLHQRKFVS